MGKEITGQTNKKENKIMVTYEELKSRLFFIKEYLPDAYQDAVLNICTTEVDGRKEELLVIKRPEAEEEVFCINDIYAMSEGMTINEIMKNLALSISYTRIIEENGIENMVPLIVPKRKWEALNTYKQNLMDRLIFMVVFKTDTGIIPIPPNTPDILKLSETKFVNKVLDNLKPIIHKKQDRYIVTADGISGCAAVLKKGVLESIAEQTDSDLFVVFTSTDYATVVPDDGHTDVKTLLKQNMLNALHTDEPVLSAKIHRYSRSTGKIR